VCNITDYNRIPCVSSGISGRDGDAGPPGEGVPHAEPGAGRPAAQTPPAAGAPGPGGRQEDEEGRSVLWSVRLTDQILLHPLLCRRICGLWCSGSQTAGGAGGSVVCGAQAHRQQEVLEGLWCSGSQTAGGAGGSGVCGAEAHRQQDVLEDLWCSGSQTAGGSVVCGAQAHRQQGVLEDLVCGAYRTDTSLYLIIIYYLYNVYSII